MQDTIAKSAPAAGTEFRRPMWTRLLALALIWTLVLQPAVSSAALSQQPLFTVTSVPPNVMLMLDDSGSMNLLNLKPPAAMENPVINLGTAGAPALKLNTLGYYGVKGSAYDMGSALYDGRWRQGLGDVLRRAPAFNPLAYNPAVTYYPWNNNGARLANASFGGPTNVQTGTATEWDKRTLPANMGGGAVSSKLVGTQTGWIPDSTLMPRSMTSTPAGTVNYERLSAGNTPQPPEGADLFTGTIQFINPNCGGTVDRYWWQCQAGGLYGTTAASDACGLSNVNGLSVDGKCCTMENSSPSTRGASRNFEYGDNQYPNGSPPPAAAIFGNGGETCNSVSYVSARNVTITPLTGCIDPAPYVGPCAGGGGELCTFDDPPHSCDTAPRHTWRCNYTEAYTATTCVAEAPQVCRYRDQVCDGSSQGLTSTSDAVYSSGYWTPARYVTYDGPQPGTLAERLNLDNYRVVMIDRQFGWSGTSRAVIPGVSRYDVVDAISGLPGFRPDCAAGTWCTFPEEAQNYANWFTYYRSRLFAAVGVLSEVLSNFTGSEQYMRIGYGRLNHFPYALNPWNVSSIAQGAATVPTVDGQSAGAVERGVRPFTVFNPPTSVIPNTDRAKVFDWLFTINGHGPTPSREALHATGYYFANNNPSGPWAATPGTSVEPSTQHLWCRRNYTVLATDGEWTRLPTTLGFTPQRLLERPGDFPTLAPLGSPSVSQSIAVNGPALTGSDRLTNVPLNYQYIPASEPQISGGSGMTPPGETLSDVLLYYWSRDMRPDLRDSIVTTPTNRAFWQHMSAYIVGYGVNATMDDPTAVPSLRTNFSARNSITWPAVGPEPCRQFDDNAADAAIPNRPACTLTVAPSGNRVNDELRGALSSGGDFFSANSPAALRAALDAVFAAIGAENASGTSPSLSSTTVSAGNLIVESNFRTNIWEGYVDAFDQVALVNFLVSGGIKPAPLWSATFAPPASRNIFTTTATTTVVPFDWTSLSPAQKTSLDVVNLLNPSSPVLDYLRGDQTGETKNGGAFRSRFNTILGDVVNSSPLYSKAADFAYQLQPAGSFVLPVGSTQGYSGYRTYVANKKTTRQEVVLFGANDGMLHVLDARTSPAGVGGRELFAFVPRSTYPTLKDLSQAAYLHKYYVDGPIVEGDVWNGTNWKTIAVGTTGAGQPGLFAIDITAPENGFTGSNVLWDIVPSDNANPLVQQHLGSVLHAGYIGSVKDSSVPNGKGRWAYIVGNGYESASNQATLLVFDAISGVLIKAITTPAAFNLLPNGLGAITPVFDGARNVTGVYAGDKLGNLWKFDLSSSTVNDPDGAGPQKGWEVFNKTAGAPVPLFQPTDEVNYPLTGNPQPITAEPRITTHPISGLYVAFGTGKMFESTDPSSLQTQSIYVLWDQNNIAPLTKPQLQRIRMNEFPFDHDSNAATPNEIFRRFDVGDLAAYDWNDKGFYIPLINGTTPNGERVIAAPILDGGVMAFTSFAPTSAGDLCIPGGASYLYRLNLGDTLASSGFINVPASVGRRIQPGLVNSAPPIYLPAAVGAGTVDSMNAADVTKMLKNPKYKMSGTRATSVGTGACAHVGLRVDGERVHIPTQCAGTMPLRVWRPVR